MLIATPWLYLRMTTSFKFFIIIKKQLPRLTFNRNRCSFIFGTTWNKLRLESTLRSLLYVKQQLSLFYNVAVRTRQILNNCKVLSKDPSKETFSLFSPYYIHSQSHQSISLQRPPPVFTGSYDKESHICNIFVESFLLWF